MGEMSFTDQVKAMLQQSADPSRAEAMAKYMRNLFPFYGANRPVLDDIFRRLKKLPSFPDANQVPEVVLALFEQPERECQYLALEILKKHKNKLEPSHLPLIEQLITHRSWWDTVDMLAGHIAGHILLRHPDHLDTTLWHWNQSANMWLVRSSIIAQLKFKKETREKLLFDLISPHTGNKEFFIAKAIGWALREYAKTNPDSVTRFIAHTEMQPLSRREALKNLQS